MSNFPIIDALSTSKQTVTVSEASLLSLLSTLLMSSSLGGGDGYSYIYCLPHKPPSLLPCLVCLPLTFSHEDAPTPQVEFTKHSLRCPMTSTDDCLPTASTPVPPLSGVVF